LVSRYYTYTQDMLDSTNSDPNIVNTIITGDESWVYGYDPENVIFLTMKIQREHCTLLHSNATCHQLTLLTGGKKTRMHMKVQGRLMQVHFIQKHEVLKKKSDTFPTECLMNDKDICVC
jgi:hypothetical protein